jgi:hypothetical protein
MIAKLVVEGKEFDIEILDPKLQELIAPKKKTGYERVNEGGYYCIINNKSTLTFLPERGDEEDKMFYDSANYYESEFVAAQNARADTLMRHLRRFAVEHRQNEIDWNEETYKYVIRYKYGHDDLCSSTEIKGRDFGCICFDTEDDCKLAIEAFRDELIWYFTEYKDSL